MALPSDVWYKCLKPVFRKGYACFFIEPTNLLEARHAASRFSDKDELVLTFKKFYKKRTRKQLNLARAIARRMAATPDSECYGMSADDIYLGIKFKAVDFGYPVIKVPLGKERYKTVPETMANEGMVSTKEGRILIETAFLCASDAGVDVTDYLHFFRENHD